MDFILKLTTFCFFVLLLLLFLSFQLSHSSIIFAAEDPVSQKKRSEEVSQPQQLFIEPGANSLKINSDSDSENSNLQIQSVINAAPPANLINLGPPPLSDASGTFGASLTAQINENSRSSQSPINIKNSNPQIELSCNAFIKNWLRPGHDVNNFSNRYLAKKIVDVHNIERASLPWSSSKLYWDENLAKLAAVAFREDEICQYEKRSNQNLFIPKGLNKFQSSQLGLTLSEVPKLQVYSSIVLSVFKLETDDVEPLMDVMAAAVGAEEEDSSHSSNSNNKIKGTNRYYHAQRIKRPPRHYHTYSPRRIKKRDPTSSSPLPNDIIKTASIEPYLGHPNDDIENLLKKLKDDFRTLNFGCARISRHNRVNCAKYRGAVLKKMGYMGCHVHRVQSSCREVLSRLSRNVKSEGRKQGQVNSKFNEGERYLACLYGFGGI